MGLDCIEHSGSGEREREREREERERDSMLTIVVVVVEILDHEVSPEHILEVKALSD